MSPSSIVDLIYQCVDYARGAVASSKRRSASRSRRTPRCLTAADLDLMRRNGFSVSVSLDGVGAMNDRHRRDRRGSSSERAIEAVRPLLDDPGSAKVAARVTVPRDDLRVLERVEALTNSRLPRSWRQPAPQQRRSGAPAPGRQTGRGSSAEMVRRRRCRVGPSPSRRRLAVLESGDRPQGTAPGLLPAAALRGRQRLCVRGRGRGLLHLPPYGRRPATPAGKSGRRSRPRGPQPVSQGPARRPPGALSVVLGALPLRRRMPRRGARGRADRM